MMMTITKRTAMILIFDGDKDDDDNDNHELWLCFFIDRNSDISVMF
jgi:hypothetical protein